MMNEFCPDSSSQTNLFSTMFLNIDGNQSNFDHLVTELTGTSMKFSAIALAETNITECNKDLYKIDDDYSSVYLSKNEKKAKGSGLGLYIHNKYNFSVVNDLTVAEESIESLFVEITNTVEPTTVGVIHHSPNSTPRTHSLRKSKG